MEKQRQCPVGSSVACDGDRTGSSDDVVFPPTGAKYFAEPGDWSPCRPSSELDLAVECSGLKMESVMAAYTLVSELKRRGCSTGVIKRNLKHHCGAMTKGTAAKYRRLMDYMKLTSEVIDVE